MVAINAINVNIRKLHEDAVIPRYATEGAAAFDLVSVADVIIAPGETAKIPLGLSFEIPEGYVMYVMMRSGIALKTKLRQSNGIGLIDSDYRGEVSMMFDNTHEKDLFVCGSSSGHMVVVASVGKTYDISGTDAHIGTGLNGVGERYNLDGTYLIRKGDRIAQALIQRIPHVEFTLTDELSETERGAGGFGSTGTQQDNACN